MRYRGKPTYWMIPTLVPNPLAYNPSLIRDLEICGAYEAHEPRK